MRMRELSIRKAFDAGYANAAASLSMMTNDVIHGNCSKYGIHRLQDEDFVSPPRTGPKLLFTTEIFGDITGKSYLFLSNADIEALTANIYGSGAPNQSLREEYLKEMDNILSASVITRLANELSIRIFGDIPVLAGETGGNLNNIIRDDFSEVAETVYINAGYFSVEKYPDIRPFFVWVIDSSIISADNVQTLAV
jgi:chemotaxis protein CheY-P-specific phosphatase CheC